MGHYHLVSSIALLFLFFFLSPINAATVGTLATCLTHKGILNFTTSQSNSSSYTTLLDFSLQNLRFTEPGVPKPDAIILPSSAKQVKQSWSCIRAGNWTLRVRSGGHSYEGISSTASSPFVIIDLMNLRAITINSTRKSVWVEPGATLGELYYAISSAIPSHGFSAGTCATIGVGGHIMGGGYGMLSRKYGVAADNVLEAQVITANGTLIKRVSAVDAELYWALRGGGGGSWGIVVAWKLKLVRVPSVMTTFNVWRTGKQAITDLVYKWQSIAPAAPPELFVAIYMAGINSSGVMDIGASFYGQYWGTINQTVALINSLYPELGLTASNCNQGDWIQAIASIAGVSGPSALLSRQQASKNYFKAKSDYVTKPLTKQAIGGAFNILEQNTMGWMIFEPYGGIMANISSNAIAFPHRAGNLFVIQYQATWSSDANSPDHALITWLDGLYNYTAPFVSYTPSRSAYVNYIDLDLGDGTSAGKSYFGPNFPKLVNIKAKFDPYNVFNQPQSVPTHL